MVRVMDTILFLIGFSVLLVVPGSSSGSVISDQPQITSSDIIEAAYANGYTQILAANLSPKCKEEALNDLAAAHQADANMTCKGVEENLEDLWEIVDTALNSIGQLVTDLNTVINSVPMCWNGEAWYNLPGKLACVFGQISTVWTALKDFWNYNSYVMETVDVIKKYVKCLENKNAVSKNVQVIVETAKLCR
uniref:Uncharacterized protein n=1 Tax=Lygus hesperus TaxID=30085 RepID=A0A146LKI5_LYGHE